MSKQKGISNLKRFFIFLHTLILVSVFNFNMVLASSPNYAESAGKWVLGQLSWVLIVIIAFLLVTAFLKRSFTSCVVIVIVGGLLLYFVNNDTAIKGIGDAIAGVFLK